ncbi:alpha/beta hydrolase [Nocardioides speluncae]|uniref:alpha/beta hydrolase n=1 Tax=Nocardioides speluncae TaxID=2670337 RepID=UPI000D694291|nr:alpha/beta hydrolase [Nocardioides speluncae]
MRPPTRILALTTALALAAVAAPAAGATQPRSGLDRFVHQHVNWTKCQLGPDDEVGKELDAAGARCADITVPVDYANPDGRTMTVAISRLEGSDRRHRVGALFLNSGGPAGTAVDMPLSISQAMGRVAERYDLIGMDPRFVGRSTPLDCGWPVGSMIMSAGVDRAGFEHAVGISRDLAERCGRTEADVLPFVTTRNTARDMDLIRAVLGERKLSYLGYSYGSYLGAVYAELFPRRVDRFVLDGPIDPDSYSARLLEQSGPANEEALAAWAGWAAERDATYHLGDTQADVLTAVHATIAAAAERPLRIGEYRVGADFLPTLYFALLGSDLNGPRDVLARATRVFVDAVGQGAAEPTDELSAMLEFMLTDSESALASVQAAIICGDSAQPGGDVEQMWRRIEGERARLPFAAPLVHNVNPCDFWPTAPREPLTRVDTNVSALIVASTGDPRTIYPNAAELRDALSSRSRVVSVPGNHHGVYAEYGNACADATVNSYLASGRLPRRDVVCGR